MVISTNYNGCIKDIIFAGKLKAVWRKKATPSKFVWLENQV